MTYEMSKIVASWKKYNSYILWSQCVGWTCMPLCCLGLVCLAPSYALKEGVVKLRKVIDLYGEDTLHRLAGLVLNQNEIFLRACDNVNKMDLNKVDLNKMDLNKTDILPNLTLLETISHGNNEVGIILSSRLEFTSPSKKTYKTRVYEEWLLQGGNIDIVVFGLPELICLSHDPTSIKVMEYIDKLAYPTQLKNLVMSHRAMAGF
jgi:hypothetical protein